jgi:hypothetical protein
VGFVYQMKVLDVDELRSRITAACENVISVTLQNTWREICVSSGHLLGYQVHTCRDLLRNIKTLKLSASFSVVAMFLSVLI